MSFCAAILSVAFVSNVGLADDATDAQKHYERAIQIVDEHFLWEDRLDADWAKLKTAPSSIQNMKDAERELDKALDTLGDKYTYYKNATVTTSTGQKRAKTNVVSSRMLPDDILYIKITTFSSENTADEVEEALKQNPTAKGYLIDLRNNGGGLVWQSFRVFALFADKGLFQEGRGRWDGKPWKADYTVTAQHLSKTEQGQTTDKPRPQNLSGNKPIMILVNGGTASASEALSGALKFHRGAELVGEKTFGKGIMQDTFNLDHGTSVKVTFAYIHQPDGKTIHGVGMTPDHPVKKARSGDSQLNKAVELLKKKI